MVAIVSGNGLGLNLSSGATLGQQGMWGNALLGGSGERAYVNASTGNLILQRQDDYLASTGADVGVVRTYNSRGTFGSDADNWLVGIAGQSVQLNGTYGAVGSTMVRMDADGASSTYAWVTGRNCYVSTDGAGAYDTLKQESTNYVWTDGATGATEKYAIADGRLASSFDAAGNKTDYTYSSGRLSSVIDASGDTTYFDYDGSGNLSAVRIGSAGSPDRTRVRYTYDTNNRLTQVQVDLTPESTSDSKFYTTTYTYKDATSKLVSSITQNGTLTLAITYDVQDRVQTLTDALGAQTTYSYDTANRRTTVTDPAGFACTYAYDTAGQLLSVFTGVSVAKPFGLSQMYYGYDNGSGSGKGDVTSITDGLGHTMTMEYDAYGNQKLKTDALGNTVTSTYNTLNQLVTQTIAGNTGTATNASLSLTTRYVYDTVNLSQLRFVLSPEGRVTEFKYDGQGQRTSSIEYAASVYPLGGLSASSVPTRVQMDTWVTDLSAQDRARIVRTDMAYRR